MLLNGCRKTLTGIITGSIILMLVSVKVAAVNDTSPFISRIKINGDSVVYSAEKAADPGLKARQDVILSFRENNFSVECEPEEKMEYQFFLEGFDREPSSWKQVNFKEYTNLPAGRYTLKISCMGPEGKPGRLDPLTLRILPSWYNSGMARIFYLLFIGLLVWTFYQALELRFAERQYMLEQIINKRTEDLIIEKEKSEALLANILPKNTADEIMLKGKATKMKYNFVTVLFSDIQGFTQIAEEMNPEVLIDELDKFFFHFDSVVEKYRIEKIKTIGDAYMCAGGIPEKNRTNPVEVILAALEMQDYMKKLKEASMLTGMKYWDIRIGIHTGTVIAGVVGHKKLSYDIWGDTVNTASRMESSGEGGKVNISGTTYEFVREFFICEHRGKMPVKYKGELDMYFVRGIRPELCDDERKPDETFILKMQMIKLLDVEELVIKMFEDEAPPNLYFHNSAMLKSICGQVDLLAHAEKIAEKEFVSLKLAAIFLIPGFISDYEDHVNASCMLAEEILPRYGFNDHYIEAAKRMITGSFSNNYESAGDRILHDARFDYMGRVDFIDLTRKLFRERTENGLAVDINTWTESQKRLVAEHEFLTGTARMLRNVSVEEQVSSLGNFNK